MKQNIVEVYQQLHTAHSQGNTGNGVTLAVLDTGIYEHADFKKKEGRNRILKFVDMVAGEEKPYDDNGHGTHVAGIIASQHVEVGVAPQSFLVVLKVLDKNGNGKLENMMQGLDWVLEHFREYAIRVVNISVGMPVKNPKVPEEDALVKKVEQLWDAGIVVVVAAGNEGPKDYSVTSPGVSRKVITVGAINETEGLRRRENASYYSGRGPVPGSCVCKPDLCAPGNGIISCDNQKDAYKSRSGTSMAAPFVAGLVALMLEKNPEMTNIEVKKKLLQTARDCGLSSRLQGCGLIWPEGVLFNV